MKRRILSFTMVLVVMMSLCGVNAVGIEFSDDFDAFAATFKKAEGTTLFNNYFDSLATSSGIMQPLSIKFNSDTRLTWIATYHESVFEQDLSDMVIIFSKIDPTIKGAKKTIASYAFKTTSYGIATTDALRIDKHYFVAMPNLIIPKGDYVISVRNGDVYFPTLSMETATLLKDLDEYMSHYTWMGNTNTANPTGTFGSLSIKGVAGTLVTNQNAVVQTDTMYLSTLQAEIKKIKDDAFTAYINSDEYREAWALVEEELIRVEAYNRWKSEQEKIMLANRPIALVVNGFTVPTTVSPVNQSGRVLVPVRALTEALDCSVAYDSKTKVIRIADNATGALLIKMVIGNRTASVLTPSGWYDDRVMDVPPQIINGSTMVPARFIGEAMDFHVEWSASKKAVTITTGGQG